MISLVSAAIVIAVICGQSGDGDSDEGLEKCTVTNLLQNMTNICVPTDRQVEKHAGSSKGQHNVRHERHHCSQHQQSGG